MSFVLSPSTRTDQKRWQSSLKYFFSNVDKAFDNVGKILSENITHVTSKWESDISQPLFMTISCWRCSLRFPDIRKQDKVFEIKCTAVRNDKNQVRKLKNQDVRNESYLEDRSEHRHVDCLKIKQ